jgi:nickel/cobalt transporter (NicO) family protein
MDALAIDLLLAAAAVAVVHTALGPDHTVPFVMLARARGWSRARTVAITFLCGLGHVGSSVVLGFLGVALGLGVARIQAAESVRGGWAAWALVALGAAYAIWGVRVALRRGVGIAPHDHHGHVHLHAHGDREHSHATTRDSRTTFWALFVVFVLGPCEPLIPLFVLPASRGRWGLAAATAVVFSAITLATMITLVSLALAGMRRLPLAAFDRWSHAFAGGVIAASGLAVICLGLWRSV